MIGFRLFQLRPPSIIFLGDFQIIGRIGEETMLPTIYTMMNMFHPSSEASNLRYNLNNLNHQEEILVVSNDSYMLTNYFKPYMDLFNRKSIPGCSVFKL